MRLEKATNAASNTASQAAGLRLRQAISFEIISGQDLPPGDQLSLAFPVPRWLGLEKLGPQLGPHMAKAQLDQGSLPETLIFVSTIAVARLTSYLLSDFERVVDFDRRARLVAAITITVCGRVPD